MLPRRSDREALHLLRTARLVFLGLAVISVIVYYVMPSARPAVIGLAGVVGVAAIATGSAPGSAQVLDQGGGHASMAGGGG